MQVELLGWTEVDGEKFAQVVYDFAQLEISREADLHPVPLSKHSRFLSQVGNFSGGKHDLAVFLRQCNDELTFLHFLFVARLEDGDEADEILTFLRFSSARWVAVPGNMMLLLGGDLQALLNLCYDGTNHKSNHVCEFFDFVFLILAEVEGLNLVMKRFTRQPREGGLFSLRKENYGSH